MRSLADDGGAAYPQPQCPKCGTDHEPHTALDCGMTLRDHFAAKAIHGLLSSNEAGPWTLLAERAYLIADAMLKARDGK